MSHLQTGDDNVFSKIIDGTIPCFKIFETEDFPCFCAVQRLRFGAYTSKVEGIKSSSAGGGDGLCMYVYIYIYIYLSICLCVCVLRCCSLCCDHKDCPGKILEQLPRPRSSSCLVNLGTPALRKEAHIYAPSAPK